MAVLTKGHDFSDGEQVTSAKLDAAVDSATFAAGSVDNVSTQLSGGGIIVKDGGVGTSKIADSSVTTPKIADDAITPAKLSAGAPSWNSNSKVGINTSSPNYTLDVNGTIYSNGTGNLPAIVVAGNSTSEGDICCPDGDHLTFGHHTLDGGSNSFTERMRINSDGHITGSFVSAYPVGSIYMNASNSTNPSTLLGFGTWVSFGAGRVLVGIDGSQSEFNSIGETGGSKTHVLSIAEMPSHTHTMNGSVQSGESTNCAVGQGSPEIETNSSGGGQAHNNLQPYIVVYMWKRTA